VSADYLVIGSNSFSGASFIDHLLTRGREVIGVSRSEEVALPHRPYGWGGKPGPLDDDECRFRRSSS